MKKFKIAYLYYDLMNLYGENGNVRYLEKRLKEQDIDIEISLLSIPDKIDYKKYDFYYIGAGSEKNELLVLEDMLKQKGDIISAINNRKFFLVTGNALELFGKNITIEDKKYEGIKAYGYEAYPEKERIVGEQYYKCDLVAHNIIGFQNRTNVMSDNGDNLFKVIQGVGYNYNVQYEGIHDNNFYGTYLLGPILVRNPFLCDYFVKEICDYLGIEYKKPDTNQLAYKAYNEYLLNFLKDLNS